MGNLLFYKAKIDSYRDPQTRAVIDATGYQGAWTVEALKAYTADNLRWRTSDPAVGGIACSTSEDLTRTSTAVGMTPAELLHLVDELTALDVIDSGRWHHDRVIAFTDPQYCDGIDRCIEWRRAAAAGGEAGAGTPKARDKDNWTPWKTRAAMAALLQVHPDTVSRRAQRGDIERRRFSHGVRYRIELQADAGADENDIENDGVTAGIPYIATDSEHDKGEEALSNPKEYIIPFGGCRGGADIEDDDTTDARTPEVEPATITTACEDRPGRTNGGRPDQGHLRLAELARTATLQARASYTSAAQTPAADIGTVEQLAPFSRDRIETISLPAADIGTIEQWAVVIARLQAAAGADLRELHRRIEAYIHEPGGLTWTPHRDLVDSPEAFRRALQGRSMLVSLDRWRKARAVSAGDGGYTRDVNTAWKTAAPAAESAAEDRITDEQEQQARVKLQEFEQREAELRRRVAGAEGEPAELTAARAELGKVRRLRAMLVDIVAAVAGDEVA